MAGYAFPTTVSPFPRSFRFPLLRSEALLGGGVRFTCVLDAKHISIKFQGENGISPATMSTAQRIADSVPTKAKTEWSPTRFGLKPRTNEKKQTRTLFNDAPSLSSPSLFSFIFTFSSLFSSRSSKMLFSSLPAFSPTSNSSGSAFSPNKFASGSTFASELEFDFSLLSLRSSGAATAVSPTTSTSSEGKSRCVGSDLG
ncbi:hypothetical protein B0H14DRAFT_3477233 [Mycena olivaceomarginata]|nr:hypothetical protein B0H14DRAFT_3477233 [Mycena olivaceomarginata]